MKKSAPGSGRPDGCAAIPVRQSRRYSSCWGALLATGLYLWATMLGPCLHLLWHSSDHDHHQGRIHYRAHHDAPTVLGHSHPHPHHHLALADSALALLTEAAAPAVGHPDRADFAQLTRPILPGSALTEHADGSLSHFAGSFVPSARPPLWLTAYWVRFVLAQPPTESNPPLQWVGGSLGARGPPAVLT